MRRTSRHSGQKLSPDSQRIINFSQALVSCASRLEERAWEEQLDRLIRKLLKSNNQGALDIALDQLSKVTSGAFEALLKSIEAASESATIERDGEHYDALLLAVPILAWTRFSIPTGIVAEEVLAALAMQLQQVLLAPGAQVKLAPTLFSIDQLPQNHAGVFQLTQRMAQAILNGGPLQHDADAPETAQFLADVRFLIATVLVPSGKALFRWQESLEPADRESALKQWRAQAIKHIGPLLPGCGIELMLPEAYHNACREADKKIRPDSIRAAVHYLTHALGLAANELQAVIGQFGEESGDRQIDEYRISFLPKDSTDVVYGVVWPLYGQEDSEALTSMILAGMTKSLPLIANDTKQPIDEIIDLLKECGVTQIKQYAEHFAMEFCDDCGSPLYADLDAELVHPEMPDSNTQGSTHLH